MNKSGLKKQIITKYLNFIQKEYKSESVDNERYLDLMYTTIEDDEVEIQCSYDMEEEWFVVEINLGDEKFIHKEKDTLGHFNKELDILTFEGLYSYAHQICEEKFSLDLEW